MIHHRKQACPEEKRETNVSEALLAPFSCYSCYILSMEIVVQLPDDLDQHPNPGREALEALVIQGYRAGSLSHYQASQLLGMTRFQFDGFLKDHNVSDHAYGIEDFENDRKTLDQLRAKGLDSGR